MRFALNHIISPRQTLAQFFTMAKSLGCSEVEIRNDMKGTAIADGTPPEAVRDAAAKAGVTIITINALYPFNVWSEDMAERTTKLARYAKACGAKALVMCPLNEGKAVPRASLVAGLKGIRPILDENGLTGLVEPLGFHFSSMRTKAEALSAIKEAGGEVTYKLVHDTFHHHLGGETEFYPDRTGLVHISGVSDPEVAVNDMLDAHRVLIDSHDRLDNIAQIKTLIAAGYKGPFSFEPFSEEVQALANPAAALRTSVDYISSSLRS
ncbi:TIM barrel protein [Aestuariivirga sp.]|uniref:TIM barrel protein n=1 Tax=Aestuariivirga sp. TaxID=2650926 RepID=UPI0039E64756